MAMHARKKSHSEGKGGRPKPMYGDPGTRELLEDETMERCTRCGCRGRIAVTKPRGVGVSPQRICHGCLTGEPPSATRSEALERRNTNLHRSANRRWGER
jgi:hypothetical protein